MAVGRPARKVCGARIRPAHVVAGDSLYHGLLNLICRYKYTGVGMYEIYLYSSHLSPSLSLSVYVYKTHHRINGAATKGHGFWH